MSDFTRAQQTADALGYGPEVYREEHAMLGEQDYGMWYACTEVQMDELFPAEVRRRDLLREEGIGRSFHWRPLAGQSGRDVETRVWAFWHDVCQRFAGKRLVVVGHGTWATVFVKVLLRWTAREYEDRFRAWHPKNASVLHFHAKGRHAHQLMAYDPKVDCVTPCLDTESIACREETI